MNNSKEFLGTEPIGKLLFKLAVPSVIAQIVNMLYNIVDRIYIGHIPGSGSLALTGVGVCLPIIMVVSAFAALVGSGGAPRASIFMGKDDMDSAELFPVVIRLFCHFHYAEYNILAVDVPFLRVASHLAEHNVVSHDLAL